MNIIILSNQTLVYLLGDCKKMDRIQTDTCTSNPIKVLTYQS